MNRRNFLKSLGVACGTAIVAPATLLKGKPERSIPFGIPYWAGKGGSRIEGYIDCDAPVRWVHHVIINDKPCPFLVKENDETIQKTK